MAANTPVSVASVVATIGHIWRDFKCVVLMSGCALCFSMNQNAKKHAAAAASKQADAGLAQPREPPLATPTFTKIRAADSAVAPVQSMLAAESAMDSGT